MVARIPRLSYCPGVRGGARTRAVTTPPSIAGMPSPDRTTGQRSLRHVGGFPFLKGVLREAVGQQLGDVRQRPFRALCVGGGAERLERRQGKTEAIERSRAVGPRQVEFCHFVKRTPDLPAGL